MGNSYTPRIEDIKVETSGNPLQLRGIMRVIANVYREGMTLDQLQTAFGEKLQGPLRDLVNNLDSDHSKVVLDFLRLLDNTLTNENNRQIRLEDRNAGR